MQGQMYEWIVVILLCLILIFFILSYRKLLKIIQMKKVIFEFEHQKDESLAPRQQKGDYLIYEDAEFEYLVKSQARKERAREDKKGN